MRALGPKTLTAIALILFPSAMSHRAAADSTISPDDRMVMEPGGNFPVEEFSCDLNDYTMLEFKSVLVRKHQPGRIVKCELAVGFGVPVAGGNNYYAAILWLKQPSQTVRVQMCFEEQLGNFKLEPVPGVKPDKRKLIEFLLKYCSET